MKFIGSNFVGGAWQNGFGVHFSRNEDNTYSSSVTFAERRGHPALSMAALFQRYWMRR
jgi:hypothetical protein